MRPVARDATVGVAALLVLLALHIVPVPLETELARRAFSALHAPAFAVLAILARAILAGRLGERQGAARQRLGPWRLDLAALALTASAGVVLELAQVKGPRSAELDDLAADVAGAVGGLALRAAWRAPADGRAIARSVPSRAAAGLLGLLILVTPAWPAAARYAAVQRRDAAFPLLGTFEEGWELSFWSARRSSVTIVEPPGDWPGARGKKVARVRFGAAHWPGVALDEPRPDWSRHRALVFETYLDAPRPLTLHVRIEDLGRVRSFHDRYDGTLQIRPGPGRHEIDLDDVRTAPIARELDLTRVAGVYFFFDHAEVAETPTSFYLDAVKLVD